jgi:hypothetical protein
MPKIQYQSIDFRPGTLQIIEQAEAICDEYAAQGFSLTLRQLYYQFVARDILPNNDKSYSRLGDIVANARLAGLIDWDHLEDRTRNVRSLGHWPDPSAIIESAAASFRLDKWAEQPTRPEVWIEKDALVGVIEPVCQRNDVPYFSCRGYTSLSEVWRAARRLMEHAETGQQPLVIHLGDHDPSGIDMSRDIRDRLAMFLGAEGMDPPQVERIALNIDQVRRYRPPPNPAKLTDSRAAGYVHLHGPQSWELDALSPPVIDRLIQDVIDQHKRHGIWAETVRREQAHRRLLDAASARWQDVSTFLEADHA